MKILLILLCGLPLFSLSQDCGNYLFMTKNTGVTMTIYDKKGKESGTQTWTINDVKNSGGVYQSAVSGEFKDDKGKVVSKSDGSYQCEKGVLKADVRMSMPQQQMENYKDAEAKFESAYIEYPSSMTPGQALSNVDFKMEVDNKGVINIITFKMTDRKVEIKESVTTPAGTWDAYVITYNSVFRIQIGPIGMPVNLAGKEWFVPGVGVVKTESYSKGGKLAGSTQITSITK